MAEGSTGEMSQEHRELFRRNSLYFSKNLVLSEDFYYQLENNKVVTRKMYDNIKHKSSGSRDIEIRELIGTVTRRGNTALYWFLDALHKSEQVFIAQYIQDQQPGPLLQAVGNQGEVSGYPVPIKKPIRVSDDEPVKYPVREADHVAKDEKSHFLDLEPREDGGEETVRHKVTTLEEEQPLRRAEEQAKDFHLPSMPPSINDYYDVSSSPCGLMLIIDISKFIDPIPNRSETAQDVERLKNTFSRLGFEIIIKYNLTKKSFREVLMSFVNDRRHADLSSVGLVVMSHGRDGTVLTSDGEEIPIDNIVRPFSKKPHFDTKPKLLLFHVCRVKQGTSSEASTSSTISETGAFQMTLHETDGKGEPSNTPSATMDKKVKKIFEGANGPDMLIVYPTLYGMKAKRTVQAPNPEDVGAWVIRVLCEVIDEYVQQNRNIENLLKLVRKKVSQYVATSESGSVEQGVSGEASVGASVGAVPKPHTPQIVEVITTLDKHWFLTQTAL